MMVLKIRQWRKPGAGDEEQKIPEPTGVQNFFKTP
jgi:hypothetical protein